MDIMIAYANKRGWMTAQAGRPDVSRAGNASTCRVPSASFSDCRSFGLTAPLVLLPVVMRALAEGRIRWAFWPRGTDEQTIEAPERGAGIWIPQSPVDEGSDELDNVSENWKTDSDVDTLSEEDDDDDDSADDLDDVKDVEVDTSSAVQFTGSRFGALTLGVDEPSKSDLGTESE